MHELSWRDDAMNDALRAGRSSDCVLWWVRRFCIGSTTVRLESSAARSLRFLRERVHGFRSLLTGSSARYDAWDEGDVRPEFGSVQKYSGRRSHSCQESAIASPCDKR